MGGYNGCSTERHIELAEKAGALGVVIVMDWFACNKKDQSHKKFNISINAICIEYLSEEEKAFVDFLFNGFLQNYQVVVDFDLVGVHPVNKLNKGGFIFFQSFYLITYTALLIYPVFRLVNHIRNTKKLITFGSVIFVLCAICKDIF